MPRERNSYDLRTLRHVMDDSAGIAETIDTAPVLRSDVLDGLQRYLAARYRAQVVLEASGYREIIAEANAILNEVPELSAFLSAIQGGQAVDAYRAITDIGVKVGGGSNE